MMLVLKIFIFCIVIIFAALLLSPFIFFAVYNAVFVPAGEILQMVSGVFALLFLIYFFVFELRKVNIFLEYHKLPGKPRHPRGKMRLFLVKIWAVVFILSILSFNIYWFAVLPAWAFVIFIFARFWLSWQSHGYSTAKLFFSTAVFTAVSFLLSPFIRAGIYSSVHIFGI